MDKDDDSGWGDLPTDALVEILAWLPPNARRRLRVVCRHWREVIEQRTATDMRRRTKIIIADAEKRCVSIVVDLLTLGSATKGLWQRQTDSAAAKQYGLMSIVGTCNGLVCLCDNAFTAGGAITVANPSTGEALRLPPLPMPSAAAAHLNGSSIFSVSRSWHRRYSFAYHQTRTAGPRYKVVHVPSHHDWFWQPDVVHVFTMGEASWREVRAAGTDARCSRLGGCGDLADVDGTVYWLTEHAERIMSFDLRHERVARTEPLPVLGSASTRRCLTKVHGRLGVAVGDDSIVAVWVLEGERWSRRYVLELEARGPWRQEKCWMMMRPRRELAGPLLVHGDYFLTLARERPNEPLVLYRHGLSGAAATARSTEQDEDGGVVRITGSCRDEDEGELVRRLFRSVSQTFVYVETKEPLSAYSAVLVYN